MCCNVNLASGFFKVVLSQGEPVVSRDREFCSGTSLDSDECSAESIVYTMSDLNFALLESWFM